MPAYGLSGGQRSRVALAAVSFVEPHVIVLDELTNNLDLESVGALAECVKAFEGGVILVSHDQFFVSQVANEVWVVGAGQVRKAKSFEGYRAMQVSRATENMVSTSANICVRPQSDNLTTLAATGVRRDVQRASGCH